MRDTRVEEVEEISSDSDSDPDCHHPSSSRSRAASAINKLNKRAAPTVSTPLIFQTQQAKPAFLFLVVGADGTLGQVGITISSAEMKQLFHIVLKSHGKTLRVDSLNRIGKATYP